jgi:hypothetical protein
MIAWAMGRIKAAATAKAVTSSKGKGVEAGIRATVTAAVDATAMIGPPAQAKAGRVAAMAEAI